MGKPEITNVIVRIKNKETGATSQEIDIEDIILNQHDIELYFDDDTQMPYKDFLFFQDEYDVNVRVKANVYREDE